MSDVVVLSDSDESVFVLPVDKRNENGSEIERTYDSDTAIDFNFPEVPFCYDAAEDLPSQNKENFSTLNDDNGFMFNAHRSSHTMSNSCESEEDQVKKSSQTRMVSKRDKATLKKERQQALARGKALKAIALKRSKDMKPGECLKFIEVNLDQGIDAFTFQEEVKNTLRNANIKFNMTEELIPNSITWQRNIEENYIGEDNEICTKKNVQMQEYVIVVWSIHEAVTHVAENTFCSSISNMKALMSNYKIVLVIFGMEEYFAYLKKRKSNKSPGSKGTRCKGNQQFDTFPIISKQQLDTCLTKVQIVAQCSNRLIENAQDLSLMIYQYTKSISEIPYKLQKSENQKDKFDWYIMGDNKNTVCVDKDGNGLKRLWQQQLCQFNLSSLETAEAICTVYSSPAQLIDAYKSCTPDKGMNLLKDIPIRRAAGPLTAVRKVGPELSKKIYTMFTSQNGDTLLGTEE
ncbi:hypothetical protein DMN91_002218 [Ooceraea biroi]|uniref:Crossover junction endonuclease EME1 n=1 Tax=Ooceraea biroi TaxID=2015173 RepID=A0A026WIC1_OOCBI|nr:crossover junction endonuclease EME1 [Ooceraea biroi]EZA55411.1 Crossover junction endonuclease EME1 [Ooceraea biroi]RLU26055.1 hypothetical protein DMN91_002218 [Ooceraea biroi]